MQLVTHYRAQFPVGEGFFHVGRLSAEGGQRLDYVYDCGAQNAYATQRDDAIAEYRDCLAGRDLHLLYLSHAHADHINGVPELLAGTTVRTIVVPLMDEVSRLIDFSHSLAADRADPDDFCIDLVLDPIATAASLATERVVVVRASATDESNDDDPPPPDGVPWSDELEPLTTDIVPPDGIDTPLSPPEWDFIGRGDITTTSEDGTLVVQIPDTVAIRPTAGAAAGWLLVPHISPSIATMRHRFLRRLASVLGAASVEHLEANLKDPAELRRVVIDEQTALRKAYRAVRSDLNLTTMSLYSGPAGNRWFPHVGRHTHRRRARVFGDDVSPIGWLGTGDAKLSVRRHVNALATHYGPLLRQVATATLPHHGSRHSFSPQLLDHIDAARFWVAPAAPYSNWKHPHPDVERAVDLAGRQVIRVDGDPRSYFGECIWIRT